MRCAPVDDPATVDAAAILAMPDALRAAQRTFGRTGSVHAAGLFTPEAEALCVHEDVGRHNAVDKVVGWAALEGMADLRGHVLMVSSRLSFEIVQKAAVARAPVVCAVSGPSNLAVTAADALGLSRRITWRRVILPQLFIRVLPPLTNEFTMLVKASPLLSVITVVELTRSAQLVMLQTYLPVEAYLVAAALYFVVLTSMSHVTRRMESWSQRSRA